MALNPNITREQNLEFLNSLEVIRTLDAIFGDTDKYVLMHEEDVKTINKKVSLDINTFEKSFVFTNSPINSKGFNFDNYEAAA